MKLLFLSMGMLFGALLASLLPVLFALPTPSKQKNLKIHDLEVTGSIRLASPDGEKTIHIQASDAWTGVSVHSKGKSTVSLLAEKEWAYLAVWGTDPHATPAAFWASANGEGFLQSPNESGTRQIQLYSLPKP